jgi:hypothetical protein
VERRVSETRLPCETLRTRGYKSLGVRYQATFSLQISYSLPEQCGHRNSRVAFGYQEKSSPSFLLSCFPSTKYVYIYIYILRTCNTFTPDISTKSKQIIHLLSSILIKTS